MQIVGGDARSDASQRFPLLERVAKVILRRGVLQRPDVLAHERVVTRQKAEAVLDVAAGPKDRDRRFAGCDQHSRRRTAARSDWLRAMRADLPYAVIAAL